MGALVDATDVPLLPVALRGAGVVGGGGAATATPFCVLDLVGVGAGSGPERPPLFAVLARPRAGPPFEPALLFCQVSGERAAVVSSEKVPPGACLLVPWFSAPSAPAPGPSGGVLVCCDGTDGDSGAEGCAVVWAHSDAPGRVLRCAVPVREGGRGEHGGREHVRVAAACSAAAASIAALQVRQGWGGGAHASFTALRCRRVMGMCSRSWRLSSQVLFCAVRRVRRAVRHSRVDRSTRAARRHNLRCCLRGHDSVVFRARVVSRWPALVCCICSGGSDRVHDAVEPPGAASHVCAGCAKNRRMYADAGRCNAVVGSSFGAVSDAPRRTCHDGRSCDGAA